MLYKQRDNKKEIMREEKVESVRAKRLQINEYTYVNKEFNEILVISNALARRIDTFFKRFQLEAICEKTHWTNLSVSRDGLFWQFLEASFIPLGNDF